MVNGVPHACIPDPGVEVVTSNMGSIRSTPRRNTPPWPAPEVLRGENPRKESDVYSFAILTVEARRE